MLRFILTRLSLIVPTFIGMTLLAFFLIRLVPGDPIETLAGERGIDATRHAALLKEYGLDRPILVQYGIYIGRVLHGDLGKSLITQAPVLDEFLALFPATVELGLCAIVFALVIGIPAGILAAVRRNSIFDHGVMGVSLTGYSMPIFWWGLLLILLFSVKLDLTPVSGRIDVIHYIEPVTGFLLIDSLISGDKGAFGSTVAHLVLPAIVLGTNPLAVVARMTRSAMLEVLGEDYIRTARAKGLPQLRIVSIHALRNALDPGDHGDRPAGGCAVHRRHPDRNHLLLARCRQVADRGDRPARLSGAARRHVAARRDGDDRQPAGRHHLRHHQPAYPGQPMNAHVKPFATSRCLPRGGAACRPKMRR